MTYNIATCTVSLSSGDSAFHLTLCIRPVITLLILQFATVDSQGSRTTQVPESRLLRTGASNRSRSSSRPSTQGHCSYRASSCSDCQFSLQCSSVCSYCNAFRHPCLLKKCNCLLRLAEADEELSCEHADGVCPEVERFDQVVRIVVFADQNFFNCSVACVSARDHAD